MKFKLSPQNYMDLIKTMRLHIFGKKNRSAESLDDYYNNDIDAFMFATLPRNLITEAITIARVKSGGGNFNWNYIKSLNLSDEAEKIFKDVLFDFLRISELMIGNRNEKEKLPIYPWRIGLFFIADESINASIKYSADENEKTAFIFINSGLILSLLHQFCAYLSVPGFFENSL